MNILVRTWRRWWIGRRFKKIGKAPDFTGSIVEISGHVEAGDGCRFRNFTVFRTKGKGRILFGHRSGCSFNCVIEANQLIRIGNFTGIAENCVIRDSNHIVIGTSEHWRLTPLAIDAIVIGDGVLVGSGCYIYPGVTIGDGAVVAAHSVVIKDIGPFEIWAGNPARKIGHRLDKVPEKLAGRSEALLQTFGVKVRDTAGHEKEYAELRLAALSGVNRAMEERKRLLAEMEGAAPMVTKPRKVRAITFDFWYTLFEDVGSEIRRDLRLDAFCRATGADRAAALEAIEAAHKEFTRHHIEQQRTLTPRDAVVMAVERLGLTMDDAAIAEVAHIFATAIIMYPPRPLPGALEAVKAAAALGPVGIISDTGMSPGSSLRVILDQCGFGDLFQSLVFSDEMGVAKPQSGVFIAAAKGLGVEPRELLHIGDTEGTDIVGAKAMDARAVLFTGSSGADGEGTAADHIITSWAEFTAALPRLTAD